MSNNIIADRYKLIKHIGHGGMADVFLAFDQVLSRDVAIKMIRSDKNFDPINLLRFKQEASAASKLIHPNIIEIYDVGEYKGRSFIVMEYIKGYTLRQIIQKRGAIIVEEAVSVMKQLTSAIIHAHQKGIIHRDIKTQNIIVKADGTIKVLDFGIALAQDSLELTNSDSVMGSIYYLAPEVVKGNQATIQSDIYALGIVFYELLVGEVPFKGNQLVEVALNHINEKLPSIRAYNPNVLMSIEMIINKACAKDLNYRYANTDQLLTDLNHCLDPNVNVVIEEIKNTSKPQNNGKRLRELNKELSKRNFDSPELKEEKKKNKISLFLGISLSIVSLVFIGAILFFAGAFDFVLKEVTMPNIIDMEVEEASTALEELGLGIDYANVERVLTINTPKGVIVETNYEEGTILDRGDLVKVTISDGIYSVMDDFTNYSIDEAKEIIATSFPNIYITERTEVSEEVDPGLIIRQEGLLPNDHFDASKSNELVLVYSAYTTVVLEHNLVGRAIDDVKLMFENQGIIVEVQPLLMEELTKAEAKKVTPNTLIRTNPGLGTSYTQQGDNKLILYYVSDMN